MSSQADDGAEDSDAEGEEDAEDDSKVDPNEDPVTSVDDDVHVRSLFYTMPVVANFLKSPTPSSYFCARLSAG